LLKNCHCEESFDYAQDKLHAMTPMSTFYETINCKEKRVRIEDAASGSLARSYEDRLLQKQTPHLFFENLAHPVFGKLVYEHDLLGAFPVVKMLLAVRLNLSLGEY
jgi:hypothetical protein